jgi:hypothetical protein
VTTSINNLKQHEKNASFEQTLSFLFFLDIIIKLQDLLLPMQEARSLFDHLLIAL